jgi:hypothetical protein
MDFVQEFGLRPILWNSFYAIPIWTLSLQNIANDCCTFSIQPPQEKVKKSVQGSTVMSIASMILAAETEHLDHFNQ